MKKTNDHSPKSVWDFILVSIFFILGTWFLIIEYKFIENTLDGAQFLIISGLIGILSVIFFFLINTFLFQKNREKKADFSILIYIYVFFLTPAFFSFSNRTLGDSKIKCESYFVDEVDYRIRKGRKSYWLDLKTGKSSEQFSINQTQYEQFLNEKNILVCTKTGFFGYRYVHKFKKMNNVE